MHYLDIFMHLMGYQICTEYSVSHLGEYTKQKVLLPFKRLTIFPSDRNKTIPVKQEEMISYPSNFF